MYVCLYICVCTHIGGAEQKSAGYGNDVWEDDNDNILTIGNSSGNRRVGSSSRGSSNSTTRTSRRSSSGSNMSSMRRWLSQNTDVDVQDEEEVLYDDPIIGSDNEDNEYESAMHTPSTRHAANGSSSSSSSRNCSGMSGIKRGIGSIYDDDDGLDDPDLIAFGSTCLWERSGSTGI